MKEKDLPIDRTWHAVYTKKAKKCVLRLLHRWYDDPACKQLWEKIQLQYENLRRHVTFIRHSDLSDGDACHDEIIRRRKRQ